MKRVFKYPIPSNSTKHTVLLPQGAQVLRVGWQGQDMFMWALVEPDAPKEERYFELYGTGQDVAEAARHISTWDQGPFVFHLFEVPNKP